ncbi:hypothetical protein J6T21_03970 [Candidatus Saccharibacteria bacterium]|nr:hypothetical protein [Candidatus Saccharibacteria bacterium]
MRGKKHLISIILAGAGIIGFIVALGFVFFGQPGLSDAYFVESDRRIVSKMDNPSSKLMFGAKTLYKVYEVKDDKITSYKLYYAFENAGVAGEKFEEVKAKSLEDYNKKEVTRDGKYIIVTMKENMYKDSTPEEVRKLVRSQESTIQREPEQPLAEPMNP